LERWGTKEREEPDEPWQFEIRMQINPVGEVSMKVCHGWIEEPP
jgi:hypothetical protein